MVDTAEKSYSPVSLFVGLMVLVAWLPIPLGSNRPWAWELMHAGSLALLGVWCLTLAVKFRSMPVAIKGNRMILALLMIWAAYIGLQAMPIPGAVVDVLSPIAYQAQAEGQGNLFDEKLDFSISLDRSASLNELQKVAAYIALLILTLALITTRQRLRTTLTLLVIVGAGEALYGVVAFYAGASIGLWSPSQYANAVSGTYVNRNHFAGLMEMCIAAAVGLILAESTGAFGRGWKGLIAFATDHLLRRTGWLSFSVLLMVTSLLLSTSRGGLAALIVGVSIATLLAYIFHGRGSAETRMLPRLLILGLIGIAWLGAGGLFEKLENVGLSSNRGEIRAVTVEMIKEYPLTGSGAGTFRWVFPAYKNDSLGGGYYEHAHNDYLELFAEQGVIGFALVSAVIALSLYTIICSYRRRRDAVVRGSQFAAIAGTAAMLAHGLVDFNFNIPANAAIFVLLLGIGLAAGEIKPKARTQA